ncbi:hypothetical protein HGQ98_34820, partial [Achromobacter ruhlandii]|nr:hypothetical protein [Achromobacter ruhlandii]
MDNDEERGRMGGGGERAGEDESIAAGAGVEPLVQTEVEIITGVGEGALTHEE